MSQRFYSASSGREKSSKSIGSRTSISIKLPEQHVDQRLAADSPVQIRALSPTRTSRHEYTDGFQQYSRNTSASARNISVHSNGTIPPQATPTKTLLTDNEIKRILAARRIERCWLGYRDRQMFKLLKHAICAAEHSLSHDILRKVSPREAELVKDKSIQVKIRFRFAGCEFPPMIYFKVFTCNKNGFGVQYVSGQKMIKPASEAARDACDLMGHRKFYEQLIQDMMRRDEHQVTDEIDVTTLKDYMQYVSLLDETPSYLGGRDNSWRKLTLEILPRFTIFYDVVGFLYTNKMTPSLKAHLPVLLLPPNNDDVQLEHIRILSEIRRPEIQALQSSARPNTAKKTARRTQQAKLRANRMRKAYEQNKRASI
ncbi:hypothetical protein LSH36_381g02102 [Paralvinella palmiformis]|uniref:Uncharacterized protein n=1 Tax=Paralvinella palmiformis TaxID=53620 RepID=A0AAD9MYY1_9ANNE|nr:hypothetical protein LSH36_381g02102 [Paralvinella palmiformis]